MSDKEYLALKSKTCSVCGVVKNKKEFHKDKSTTDGFRRDCKSCCFEYQKRYRKSGRGKEVIKRNNHSWKETEEGIAKRRAGNHRYSTPDIGRETRRNYAKSDAGKAAKKKYVHSEHGKKKTMAYENLEHVKKIRENYMKTEKCKELRRAAAKKRYILKKENKESLTNE